MVFAERLLHTCNEMYRQTPTGLAPEIAIFDHSIDDELQVCFTSFTLNAK